MNMFLKSLSILWLIPLLTMAIEPSNPKSLCDRFVGEKDQQACEEKMKNDDVDWYAATVCALTQEDQAFWNCWGRIKGARFNPVAIEKCGDSADLKDADRIACLEKAKVGREPASYQPLQIKH